MWGRERGLRRLFGVRSPSLSVRPVKGNTGHFLYGTERSGNAEDGGPAAIGAYRPGESRRPPWAIKGGRKAAKEKGPMRTIFVLFGEYREAVAAVDELILRGFGPEEMNVIVQREALESESEAGPERIRADGAGRAGKGRPRGLDFLLSGCEPVIIPGIGAAYAAGKAAAAAVGATGGGQTEGLARGLADMGVPGELAQTYEGGVAGGGTLFWVRVAEKRMPEASALLSATLEEKVANYD